MHYSWLSYKYQPAAVAVKKHLKMFKHENKIIIIIIIIIYSSEFFTSALADGLSLEIEWQQVSSSLQDSSQYSGRLQ